MIKHFAHTKKKTWLLVGLLLAVALAAFSVFHIHSVHVAQHKSGNISNVTKKKAAAKVSPKKDQALGGDTTPNTGTSQKSPGSAVSSAGLSAPFGNFVSNYRPGQNGLSTQEESLCTTTPGASCYIQFTKDGIVKKLPAKTTDGSGSVIWDWDIKGSALSPGSWQIAAVATLNGETKTTIDPNGQLEVK